MRLHVLHHYGTVLGKDASFCVLFQHLQAKEQADKEG